MAIELTAREIAIAQGGDPDKIPPPESGDTNEPESTGGEQASDSAEDPDAGPDASDDTVPGIAPDSGTDSGSDSAEPETWITDDIRQQAYTYGMTPEDLDAFDSQDAFRAAGRQIDLQTARLRQQQAPPAPSNPSEPEELKPRDERGLVNPKYFEEGDYDDETVQLATALRETQDQLQQVHQTAASQQQQQTFNAFHDAVDAHRSDFYGSSLDDTGNPVHLSEEHGARREKLFEGVEVVAANIVQHQQARGEEVQLPPFSALVKRAEQLVFADELQKQEQEKRATALRNQSNKRRKVSSSTPADRPVHTTQPAQTAADIANNPDIVKFWQEAQETNAS